MGQDQALGPEWPNVWRRALVRPSVTVYRELIRAPGATALRGLIWVAASAAITYAIGAGILVGLGALFCRSGVTGVRTALLCAVDGLFPTILWAIVPFELFVVATFAANAGLSHIAGRVFGGKGTYREMVYATAAYAAPLSVVTIALVAVPVLGLILLVTLSFYAMMLNAMALKAAHDIDTWQALAANAIVQSLFFLIATLIVTLALPILGPVIQDALQEVARDFEFMP